MYSDKKKIAVISAVKAGMPQIEAAARFGVSANTIRKWLASGATVQRKTVRKPAAISRQNTTDLARVRDAIATLTEAGLI